MKTINADFIDAVLEGVTYTRDAKTKHDTLGDKPIKQSVTVDFTGMTLKDICKRAADSYIIKYQNGYARKATPETYLIDAKTKSPIEKVVLEVKSFFKGRAEKDPVSASKREMSKIDDIEQLKSLQDDLKRQIELAERNAKALKVTK